MKDFWLMEGSANNKQIAKINHLLSDLQVTCLQSAAVPAPAQKMLGAKT
jgi:hypothetical protein